MVAATMTSKGQLTIPKAIREHLGLRPGDKVDFVSDGDNGRVLMRRRRSVGIAELFRVLPRGTVPIVAEAIDEAIAEEVLEQDRLSRE